MAHIDHLADKFSLARYELLTTCDSAELHLYLYLKLYAIRKHEAFPGLRRIMDDLGWSKNKALRTIHRMVNTGRLRVRRDLGLRNVYDITEYDRLNAPQDHPQLAPFRNQSVVSERNQGCPQDGTTDWFRNGTITNRKMNDKKETITPLPPKGGCGRKVLFYENERCTWLGEVLRIQTREGWLNWGGVAPEHFAPFRYGDLKGLEAYRASRKDAGLG